MREKRKNGRERERERERETAGGGAAVTAERERRHPGWEGEGEAFPDDRCARGGGIDDPFPSPCVVTFGGSALRAGGGYAHTVLHALEPLPLDEKEDGEDSEAEEEEGARGRRPKEDEKGRVGPKETTSVVGFTCGALEAASTTTSARRPSLSKFQK